MEPTAKETAKQLTLEQAKKSEETATTAESLKTLERRIEAMLFASGEPLKASKLAEILQVELQTVTGLIYKIKDRYQAIESPITLVNLDGAFQMTTLPQYAEDIRLALEEGRSQTLTQAAMEVLAVIAYNQPVTRAFVEEVRGVDCSGHMRNLTEKGLIEESGRLSIPGNPIVYRTTSNFLRSFGLNSLEELPLLPETKGELPDLENEQIDGQIDLFTQEAQQELERMEAEKNVEAEGTKEQNAPEQPET